MSGPPLPQLAVPVRAATEADIPAMLDMGRRFIGLAWSRVGVDYDEESCRSLLLNLIREPKGILLINEEGNAMIGVLVHPWPFNHRILTATELFWWADKGAFGTNALREEAETVAAYLGARTINLAAQEHLRVEALGRLYRGAGYAPSERVFIKRIGE